MDLHRDCIRRVEEVEQENDELRQHIHALQSQIQHLQSLESFKTKWSEHLHKRTKELLSRQGKRRRVLSTRTLVTTTGSAADTGMGSLHDQLTAHCTPAPEPLRSNTSGQTIEDAICIDDDATTEEHSPVKVGSSPSPMASNLGDATAMDIDSLHPLTFRDAVRASQNPDDQIAMTTRRLPKTIERIKTADVSPQYPNLVQFILHTNCTGKSA